MENVHVSTLQSNETEVFYPDSDGQPMANNTLHAEYMATTKYGIESVFADRDDVFVAMDLFWYPVKGKPKIALAPDVIVALGRPKGERKSYKQWEEDNIAPQVVFEFLSESAFFERYGVQEYYIYDVERKELSGFTRYQEHDDALEPITDMQDWISPRLGVRFDISSGALQLYKPDGEPFLSYLELNAELSETRSELSEARKQNELLAAKLRELGVNPDAL